MTVVDEFYKVGPGHRSLTKQKDDPRPYRIHSV